MSGGKVIAALVVVATIIAFGMALVMKHQAVERRARLHDRAQPLR